MTYHLPDNLAGLRVWLGAQGAGDFKTERQATFMAQQLAGTRFKFPPQGKSCMKVLEAIQRSLTGCVSSEKIASRDTVQYGQSATRKNDLTAEIPSEKTGSGRNPVSSCGSKRNPHLRGSEGNPRGKRGSQKNPRIPVTRSQVSGKFPQMRQTGNASSQASADRPQINRAVPPGLVIYADGACEPNPGIGGWGFVVYRDGVEIHSGCGGSDPTTNNIMEMTGALMALRWIGEHLVEKQDSPRLFCDSQYVVKGCNEWMPGWKAKGWKRGGPKAKEGSSTIANLDLWKELDAALTLIPIKLEWCKGHAGIIGNERADELSLMGKEAMLELKPDERWYQIEEQLRYEVN